MNNFSSAPCIGRSFQNIIAAGEFKPVYFVGYFRSANNASCSTAWTRAKETHARKERKWNENPGQQLHGGNIHGGWETLRSKSTNRSETKDRAPYPHTAHCLLVSGKLNYYKLIISQFDSKFNWIDTYSLILTRFYCWLHDLEISNYIVFSYLPATFVRPSLDGSEYWNLLN